MSVKKKILIVDDQIEVRKLLRYTLHSLGYELIEAHDGTSALEACETFAPDVILLDIMMPGELSGFDVCKQVKKNGDDMPVVIMLTARGQEDDREEGKKVGADYYLSKPFSPMKLVQLIGRVV